MATPQELRTIRLGNDYKEMLRIRGDIISWKPLRGTAPHVEEYEITINVHTICGIDPSGRPIYRDRNTVQLSISENYPITAPQIVMTTRPAPFHPNWWDTGKWCYGTWMPSESLGNFVIRMVKTLQFDQSITNPNSPANREANDWYLRNSNSRLFPCDKRQLPDPTSAFSTTGAFVIKRK